MRGGAGDGGVGVDHQIDVGALRAERVVARQIGATPNRQDAPEPVLLAIAK
jgi:hypothetical protein